MFQPYDTEHTDVSGLALAPTGDNTPVRSRAYAKARRHSSHVRLLKVAIPVGAVIAVALVLFVTFFNPFGRIPGLSVGPISLFGTKIAMENPRLTGFRNKDGRPYEVTATAAFQDVRKPSVIELKDMKAKVTLDGGSGLAHLVSTSGVFDTAKEHLELSQDIRITTDRGDEVLLKTASVDLKAGTMISNDPVRITTPSGTVEADGVRVSDNGHTIVFTGRVRTMFLRLANEPAAPALPARVSQAGPMDR